MNNISHFPSRTMGQSSGGCFHLPLRLKSKPTAKLNYVYTAVFLWLLYVCPHYSGSCTLTSETERGSKRKQKQICKSTDKSTHTNMQCMQKVSRCFTPQCMQKVSWCFTPQCMQKAQVTSSLTWHGVMLNKNSTGFKMNILYTLYTWW